MSGLIRKHVIDPIDQSLSARFDAFEKRLLDLLRTEFKSVRAAVVSRAEFDDDPDVAGSVKRMAAIQGKSRAKVEGNFESLGKSKEVASDAGHDKTIEHLKNL